MSITTPDNIILSNAIKELTNVDFIIIDSPTTEAGMEDNIKWIVSEDANGSAIYGDNSEVTWAEIKAKFDELKG